MCQRVTYGGRTSTGLGRERYYGGVGWLWRNRGLTTTDVKMGMLESIVVPTVLYGSESLVPNARERRMVEVFDMKCLERGIRCRGEAVE